MTPRSPSVAHLLRPRMRGQALVEFALVLPVMVVILLTVLDLGRLFYSQMAVTNAAREGAFQASMPSTPAPGGTYDPTHAWYTGPGSTCNSATDAVTCRTLLEFQGTPANWFVQPAPSGVSARCVPSGSTTFPCASGIGNEAAVTVNTTFSLWSPWMGAFFGGHQTIDLSATATSQVATMPGSTAPPTSNPTSGSIEVFESTVGSDGTFDFTGTGTGLARQSPFSITTSANEGSALFTSLAPGSYSVTQSATGGWNFTGLSCTTSGSGGSIGTQVGSTAQASISLKAGDTVICTYTNTQMTQCTAPSAGFTASWTGGSASTQNGISITVPSGTTVTLTDTSTPSPPCSGTSWLWTIAVSGNGNGNGNSGSWTANGTWPGGGYSGQVPPTVTFNAPNGNNKTASFTITLKVTNTAGSATASGTITASS